MIKLFFRKIDLIIQALEQNTYETHRLANSLEKIYAIEVSKT